MENERRQTNINNTEKNNRFNLTKSKKVLPGVINTIYSKETIIATELNVILCRL